MAELGEAGSDAHKAVGLAAARDNYALVIACGKDNARHLTESFATARPEAMTAVCADAAALLDLVREQSLTENLDAILVKGSRSARMDIVSDGVRKEGYV